MEGGRRYAFRIVQQDLSGVVAVEASMGASDEVERARSLTDFLRNHRESIERLRESGAPEALTINGRPELVVQSAEGYQAALDRLDHAENVVGLWKAYSGPSQELGEALAGLRERHGLPSSA